MIKEGSWGFVVLAFLLPLVLSAPPARALADSQNIAMPPNSIHCINAYLPDDWGEIAGKTVFEITSDCGWCDLSRARVTTDQDNPVVFPICILSPGRGNESLSFGIGLEAQGKRLEFHYGVCIAGLEDLDSGSGSPCSVVNSMQDIFDFGIEPERLYAVPGSQASYTLFLQSQAGLSLELTSSYGGRKAIELNPNEPYMIDFEVRAPAQEGEYQVEILAKIPNCNFPSCSKSVSARLISGDAKPSSGNFSITLFPESYNIEQIEPVSYTLRIRNFNEEKAYNARLLLPEGLETDFAPGTMTISGVRDLGFNITPKDRKYYEITAEVETAHAKKQAKAYLTVGEMEKDLERMKQDLSGDAQRRVDQWIENYGDAGYQDKMDSFGSLLNQVNQSPQWNLTPTGGETPQGLDPLLIAVPVIVIVAILLLYFYRGRRAEEEEYGLEGY